MEIAYLGLFQDVCEWVLDHIMQPIYEWLASLLTSALTWVFKNVFQPILKPLLEWAIDTLIELWLDIYSTFIYTGFSALLKIIDYIETAFDIFIGLRDVTYIQETVNASGKIEKTPISGSLLEILLQQETINTIFWVFTLAGLGIALTLTIYATAKSAFDLDFENRRPVSKVLTSMFQTLITFFTVPFFSYFIIKLATVVLQGATYALSNGSSASLGRVVFMIASLDAVDTLDDEGKVITALEEFNVSTATADQKKLLGTTSTDIYRYPFYTGAKDYADLSAVNEIFDLSNFDYVIGFLAAIFLLVVMAMCLLTFVQRIFEVILLYAVSPYFVSMIPIDEGERFGKWREMFISKVLTGYGSVIGMRLYLLVCPMIMGSQIQFGSYVSTEMDYIMKLFFLIGGAWAVYKSGPMITSLFSYSAGQKEAATSDMVGGFVYGHTVTKAMDAGKNFLKGGDEKSPRANPNGNVNVSTETSGDEKSTGKFNGSNSSATSNTGNSRLKQNSGSAGAQSGQKPPESKAGGTDSKKDAASRQWKAGVKPQGERPQNNITIGKDRSVQEERSNIRLGSLFQSTYDEKGNHKIRVLGMGVTKDINGNTTSLKLPGMKLKRADADSSYKVSKLNIPGIAKVKGKMEYGELKYSDISVLGMRYHKDKDGSSFGIGKNFNIAHDKDGNLSDVKVGKIQTHHSEGNKGFDLGSKFSYRDTGKGESISYGNSFNVSTSNDTGKVSNVQIGKLNFEKTQITRMRKPGEQIKGGEET